MTDPAEELIDLARQVFTREQTFAELATAIREALTGTNQEEQSND